VCTCPDEDHDGWVNREYLFNCLQLVKPVHGTRGSSGATLSQKAGAGAQVTRGSPIAALSREAGAEATRTRDGPEAAPSQKAGARAMGTRDAPEAALNREADAGAAVTRDGPGAVLPFVLTWSLYGGTWSSGYRHILFLSTCQISICNQML
jgi:hypothetical protein